AASLLPGNFDHALKGVGECFSCHQATVAANNYGKYFNAAGTLPGGDWVGGVGTPDGVHDPSQDVVVVAEVPTYTATSVSTVAVVSETLPMPMFHSSTTVPPTMACASCHAGAATGAFFPGRLHSSLAAGGLAQPATCIDCHATSAPAGFVGPMDAARTPPTGEMKPDAVPMSGGAATATPAAARE